MGILSLVFGILGLCTIVTAIPGLILGIVALATMGKADPLRGGQGLAIGGVVTSVIALTLIPIWIAISLPAFAEVSERGEGHRFDVEGSSVDRGTGVRVG